MKNLIDILNDLISARITLEDISSLAIMLILVIAIVIGEKIVYRIISNLIKSTKLRENIKKVLEKFTSYFLYLIMLMLILNVLGISEAIPALLASLGFIGLALAFASQTFIQNLIAGFVILIERDLKIGDEIEVGGVRGKIYDIRLRTTRIITKEKIKVVVPNVMLINTIVKRYPKE
jgi:small-conductance mechanosensitive channel